MLTRRKWHTCNKHMNEKLVIYNAPQIIKKGMHTVFGLKSDNIFFELKVIKSDNSLLLKIAVL